MRDALAGTLATQANHAAPAVDRNNVLDPQFNRFLDGEIHLVTGLNRLNQGDRKTRLALDITPRAQLSHDTFTFNALDVRLILAATAIKQDHAGTRRQAQNAHRMTRYRLRQINVSTGRKRFPAVETG
jgi:hypothetical protein